MDTNNFIEKLENKFGTSVFYLSAFASYPRKQCDVGETLKRMILRKPTKTVLEIGTCNGISAAWMAQFVDKVITIDIVNNIIKNDVWKFLGVEDKITFYQVSSEEEKAKLMEELEYDVAFIDGEHFGEYPKSDFETVKKCGRVIFHDYSDGFEDVKHLVDSLDQNKLDKKSTFVYWEDTSRQDLCFTEFDHNITYVRWYLKGKGLDMGCGCCPLPMKNVFHIDRSLQPKAFKIIDEEEFLRGDAVSYRQEEKVDFIFSSHMVEDLETVEAITDCLNGWAEMLKTDGYLVLLLPDMQGGRYPTVEEGGNPSHRVNVGAPFIYDILKDLKDLKLVQMGTIPKNFGCTIDVVFKKRSL